MAALSTAPPGASHQSPSPLSSASFTMLLLRANCDTAHCNSLPPSPTPSLLRRGLCRDPLAIDASDLEQPFDDTSDYIIGRAGPGRDPNRQLSGGKPSMSGYDRAGLRIAIPDLVRGDQALFILNMVRRRVFGSQFRQVPRIGVVETPDHQDQIEPRGAQELLERVLAVLGRRADGIERDESARNLLFSVARHHGIAQELLDLEGLAAHHRGLIGQPDARQVAL